MVANQARGPRVYRLGFEDSAQIRKEGLTCLEFGDCSLGGLDDISWFRWPVLGLVGRFEIVKRCVLRMRVCVRLVFTYLLAARL